MRQSYADGDSNCDIHANSDCDSHGYSYGDVHTDCHRHGHSHSHSNAHGNCNRITALHAHTAASAYSAASALASSGNKGTREKELASSRIQIHSKSLTDADRALYNRVGLHA